jgi:hypothetical protein
MDKVTSELQLSGIANVTISRQPLALSELDMSGVCNMQHWREGRLLDIYTFPNGIVNQGKDLLLDVMFDEETAIVTWYLGLISSVSYSALAATDTYDGINDTNGWTEFADYTDANNASSAVTRPAWPTDAASSQSITNGGTLAIYDITSSGTVKGMFCVGGTNAQTKSDSTASGNYLWATALFNSGDVPVNNGDQLKVTYTVNA